MTTDRMQQLPLVRKALALCEQDLEETVKREWPIGSPIRWSTAKATCKLATITGTVVSHSIIGARVKVKRTDNDKTYWITASRIIY